MKHSEYLSTYRKVASRSTCYYSENQVFGGATNRDMSLNETCYYSKIQKFWTLKSQLVTCPKGWILIKILLCLDFKSFFAWISNPSLHGFQILLCLDFKFFFALISYASLFVLVVNFGLVNFIALCTLGC